MKTYYYSWRGVVYHVPASSYHEAACLIVQAFGAFVVGNMLQTPPDGVSPLPLPNTPVYIFFGPGVDF
jgi:hypothetical protein